MEKIENYNGTVMPKEYRNTGGKKGHWNGTPQVEDEEEDRDIGSYNMIERTLKEDDWMER